jgi:hypothetical protein
MSPVPNASVPPHNRKTPIIVIPAAPQTCRLARSRRTTQARKGVITVAVLTRKLALETVVDR